MISGSHGREYEDDCLLEYGAMKTEMFIDVPEVYTASIIMAKSHSSPS
jgi:hypothetical protein